MKSDMDTEPPILPAYRVDAVSTVVWCVGCVRWHWHGHGDGHRVAHCHTSESPYALTGYELQTIGSITPREMHTYAREEKRRLREVHLLQRMAQQKRESIYAQLLRRAASGAGFHRRGTYKRLSSLVERLKLLDIIDALPSYEVFFLYQGEQGQIPAPAFLERAGRWLSSTPRISSEQEGLHLRGGGVANG